MCDSSPKVNFTEVLIACWALKPPLRGPLLSCWEPLKPRWACVWRCPAPRSNPKCTGGKLTPYFLSKLMRFNCRLTLWSFVFYNYSMISFTLSLVICHFIVDYFLILLIFMNDFMMVMRYIMIILWWLFTYLDFILVDSSRSFHKFNPYFSPDTLMSYLKFFSKWNFICILIINLLIEK